MDRFSDPIIVNPKLNRNPALVEWNKGSGHPPSGPQAHAHLWVAALAGGPFKYGGMPLHDVHTRFALTPAEFDEVGAEIARALDYYKVPEREKQRLVTAFMRSKPDVVGASR